MRLSRSRYGARTSRRWRSWSSPGALDVGTDSFDDADDVAFDPTEFIDEDDEFLTSVAFADTEG